MISKGVARARLSQDEAAAIRERLRALLAEPGNGLDDQIPTGEHQPPAPAQQASRACRVPIGGNQPAPAGAAATTRLPDPVPVLAGIANDRGAHQLANPAPVLGADPPQPQSAPAPHRPPDPPDAGAAESSRPGRWRLSRRHAMLVAGGAVVLVLVTVAYLMTARPVATPVPVAPAPVSSAAYPTPSAQPHLAVHVLGAVNRPGVVQLPPGSRVADAIQAAGGLTPEANPGELNLAAVLPDGAQVVIGTRSQPRGEVRGAGAAPAPAGAAGSAGAASTKVNLNTATAEQLDALPGVGPVTAQAILQHRQRRGRFTKVSELQEVDGIGPKTYAQLVNHVTV